MVIVRFQRFFSLDPFPPLASSRSRKTPLNYTGEIQRREVGGVVESVNPPSSDGGFLSGSPALLVDAVLAPLTFAAWLDADQARRLARLDLRSGKLQMLALFVRCATLTRGAEDGGGLGRGDLGHLVSSRARASCISLSL